jgi:hypothetical protein
LCLLGDSEESHGSDRDHGDAKQNGRQGGPVGECLSSQSGLRLQVWHGRQEKIETLDQEAECHDGDCRSNPGEERPFVRRMIGISFDHFCKLTGATADFW